MNGTGMEEKKSEIMSEDNSESEDEEEEQEEDRGKGRGRGREAICVTWA